MVSLDTIITIEKPHVTMNGCSPYFYREEDVQEYLSNKIYDEENDKYSKHMSKMMRKWIESNQKGLKMH
jgi:hypothetical protein